MPHDRFFLKEEFHKGASVILADTEAHHLAHVMRGKVGDAVDLVNGQGQLAHSHVTHIDKKQVTLEIDVIEEEAPPLLKIVLAQAIPRMNRLETILEKGTEAGMTHLWLFAGERSEKEDLSETQQRRAEAILIASMKQCGRLWLPQIEFKPRISKWEAMMELSLYFGDVKPDAPLFATAWKVNPPKQGAVFVTGPESGLSEREVEHLQKIGGRGVKLHHNILRTDTASLVALALMHHWLLEKINRSL